MSSSNHKRFKRADDTQQARIVALQQFVKGDRVRHRTTRKVGSFIESHYGFALPEVWVQFDSETDIQVPISCNPLDLELVTRDCDQPNSAITPQIVEELTELEESDRHRLELKVEKAFYEAGAALRELRDRRLYRSTHRTFEEYCKDRFGYQRRHSYQLINAAVVVENLCAISAQTEQVCNSAQILPTSEYQVRPLTLLEPAQQIMAWQQAVSSAGGKVPSGRIVKSIVMQLKEKQVRYATDFCNKGDVFTLIRLEGIERKYNGCWAIAKEPRDFTVIVDVHDITLTVKPENLNKIDSPEAHRQLPQILQRIRRVRQVPGFRDRVAYTMLEHLGKQTYLTPLEDKLLQVIEQEYGVEDVNSEIGS